MINEIQIIDPCTSDEWMQFIKMHPDAGIFHHPQWLKLMRDSYGYRFFAACLKEGEEIRAGIPFADVRSFLTGERWISLPFSDHSQPLFSQRNPNAVDLLLGFLKERAGPETRRIEIRWSVTSSQETCLLRNFFHHTLKLDKDETALFKSFRKNAQRSIMKAEKEGVQVKECKTLREFMVFYNLLLKTRRRLGVPTQSKTFFKALWERILAPGLGFALISYKETIPLAGGVFLTFKNTVYYKYGAWDMKYKALRPNHAFMWKAIQRAIAEDYKSFDLGRTEKNNAGLRRFKKSWAGVESELAYTIIGDASLRLRLEKMVGIVIRNSPEFVGRLIGKFFYGHFA